MRKNSWISILPNSKRKRQYGRRRGWRRMRTGWKEKRGAIRVEAHIMPVTEESKNSHGSFPTANNRREPDFSCHQELSLKLCAAKYPI